jgi:hypothetical protein
MGGYAKATVKIAARKKEKPPKHKLSGFWLFCLLIRYLMVTASSLISIAVAPSEPMEPN